MFLFKGSSKTSVVFLFHLAVLFRISLLHYLQVDINTVSEEIMIRLDDILFSDICCVDIFVAKVS